VSSLDLALPIVLGIGLAAATGFRIFLPLLILSVAAHTGHLSLDESFAWLGTPAALTMLGTAALAEIVAYYVPGVDNLLDTVATPGAFVAGTVASAAVVTDLEPMVKWTAAVIAGGGVAGLTQATTALLRAKSTVFTGGLGKPGHRDRGTRRRGPNFAPGPSGAACRPGSDNPVPVAGDASQSAVAQRAASVQRSKMRFPRHYCFDRRAALRQAG
jgi:uncharacterized protein DUF4126